MFCHEETVDREVRSLVNHGLFLECVFTDFLTGSVDLMRFEIDQCSRYTSDSQRVNLSPQTIGAKIQPSGLAKQNHLPKVKFVFQIFVHTRLKETVLIYFLAVS